MSYTATVFNILIASPGDVEKERRIIRDKILRWNELNSAATNLVLQPIGWETHAVPELGDRPQGIINKRLVDKCDMLIGVFWTRLGTPTGRAPSGTVEEIEEFIKAKKPSLIYFSREPSTPEIVDEDQLHLLSEFRDSLKNRGLISEYTSKAEFEELLSGHLSQAVHLHFSNEDSRSSMILSLTSEGGTESPLISEDAMELLRELIADQSGEMINSRTKDGLQIQTNGRVLNKPLDARSEAKWSSARDELENSRLIEPLGYKREIFRLTHLGYKFADSMSA